MPETLTVSGLSRRFGSAWAVRDVTFVLPPHSALLVVGPNGSGKTTLLRLLATALRPTSGSATVFGFDLIRDAAAVRGLAAFVGASPGVYDLLTAAENLSFAAAMCGRPDAPVMPHLERAGLADAAHRPVRTFSQGMKRRLALARAFLAAPRLLLLDEPYAGLDRDGGQIVDALVAETKRRGGSIVLATHEWERGASVAAGVLALAAGRPADVVSVDRLTSSGLATAAGPQRSRSLPR